MAQENTGKISGRGGFGPTYPHIYTHRSTYSICTSQKGATLYMKQADMCTQAYRNVHTQTLMHGFHYCIYMQSLHHGPQPPPSLIFHHPLLLSIPTQTKMPSSNRLPHPDSAPMPAAWSDPPLFSNLLQQSMGPWNAVQST